MSISRRAFILSSSAGAAAFALASCGNPTDAQQSAQATAQGSDATGGPAAAGVVNLIMQNHPWQRAIEPLFPKFTEKTGITINVQTFAEQQMRDKILLNLQSKSNAMDLYMTLPSREGVQFSNASYYEPLDSYLEGATEYNVDDFSPGSMAAMMQGGNTVAMPLNVEGPVVFYRTDIFDKLGLQVPESVDELLQVCQAIKDSGEDIIPITLRGASAAVPYTFGPFFHGNGIEWTVDGKPNFNNPQAVAAIDAYAKLAREFGPPGVINYSFTESSNLFGQGQVAIEIESSNELNTIIDPSSSTVAENVGVTSMPAGSAKRVPTVLSWGIAMSPFGANKDNAWKFIEWATSSEVQLELTKAQIASPRSSVSEDPEYTATLDSETKKQWQEALDYLQQNGSAEVGPVGEQAAAMRRVIGDGIGTVILDQATAEEAAASIQTALEPMLADG